MRSEQRKNRQQVIIFRSSCGVWTGSARKEAVARACEQKK
jgi:hypothetical protein